MVPLYTQVHHPQPLLCSRHSRTKHFVQLAPYSDHTCWPRQPTSAAASRWMVLAPILQQPPDKQQQPQKQTSGSPSRLRQGVNRNMVPHSPAASKLISPNLAFKLHPPIAQRRGTRITAATANNTPACTCMEPAGVASNHCLPSLEQWLHEAPATPRAMRQPVPRNLQND